MQFQNRVQNIYAIVRGTTIYRTNRNSNKNYWSTQKKEEDNSFELYFPGFLEEPKIQVKPSTANGYSDSKPCLVTGQQVELDL